MAGYESFQSNSTVAMNCRGTMFTITQQGGAALVCLPPEKFFDYEEGNRQQEHFDRKFGDKMVKLDGSLISTFLHKGREVRLKSKTSLTSKQVMKATQLLTGESIPSETEQAVQDFAFS
ncbi:unnamed protein product [Didymodactylos carnosus]|uniref:Uncharacterized protein n=1 Tax=Didymodactylos carnosus TaxID=1234261 RepID=A0A814I4W5_9BILA|nr:unnamed protein product [Didymodactylos carnosus]CAF1297050.1 unnamed protein product [Didymodactylos carnosus]CAF3790664.1 unnamed protein product [Didymodactylos carnosus]CAF4102256.1 unnamed protein product [Didymodactylos carnosus]